MNVPSDTDLLLQPLAFAFAGHESGVVQNAGGLIGEGVEQLPVQLGECRRAPRIQIEHAEELPGFHVDDGLFRLGVGKGVQRNHDHRAEALGHDALRGLQIHFRLREVFGDHRLPCFRSAS